MKVYLINKNSIITKLVTMSAEKAGLEFLEAEEIDSTLQADILIIDDEAFNKEAFEAYCTSFDECKSIFIYARDGQKQEGFDAYVQKPFLPTDFVKLLKETGGIVDLPEPEPMLSQKANTEEMQDEIAQDDDISDLFQTDDEEESKELKVLDESDIDEVKNLLDDTKETSTKEDSQNDEDFALDDIGLRSEFEEDDEELDKELSANFQELGSVDGEEKDLLDGMDFDEVEAPKEDFDLEEITKDEKADESKDLDLDDFDFEEVEEEKDSTNNAENEEKSQEVDEDLMADLADLELPDLDKKDDDQLEALDLEEVKDENKDDRVEEKELSGLEDLGDLELSKDDTLENLTQEVENTTEIADNKEEQIQESQPQEAQIAEDIALDDLDIKEDSNEINEVENKTDEANEASDDDFNLDSLDGIELGEALGESIDNTSAIEDEAANEVEQDLESAIQPQESAVKESDEALDLGNLGDLETTSKTSSDDDFSCLKLEDMSEALGEPIIKDPVVAPIVPQTNNTNLQANSLEGLISALQNLQGQNIKDLLSGATINISIQFPNKDKK